MPSSPDNAPSRGKRWRKQQGDASGGSRLANGDGHGHAPRNVEVAVVTRHRGEVNASQVEGAGPHPDWTPPWADQLAGSMVVCLRGDLQSTRYCPTYTEVFGWYLPCQPPPGSKSHPTLHAGTRRYSRDQWKCCKCGDRDHDLTYRTYLRTHTWVEYLLVRCAVCGYQIQMLCADAPASEVPPAKARKTKTGLF